MRKIVSWKMGKAENAIFNFFRNVVSTMTAIYTRHCKLNYHMFKLALGDSHLCRFGNLEDESAKSSYASVTYFLNLDSKFLELNIWKVG